MYTDSHIHLQDYKTREVNNVITAAKQKGVMHFINPSSHPDDWNKVIMLAEQYTEVIPAFGIHPWYIDCIADDWQNKLDTYLQKHPLAWVGECGIDRLKNPDTDLQAQIFKFHAESANKYHRPLIVHCVKADAEMAKLCSLLPQRTIFHSFTGSAEWGKFLQNQGFYLGLNFSILRKKNAVEILQKLDIKQLLLETDGPYQNIEAGKETLPENLPFLAQKIAELLQISPFEFSEIIYRNQQSFQEEK